MHVCVCMCVCVCVCVRYTYSVQTPVVVGITFNNQTVCFHIHYTCSITLVEQWNVVVTASVDGSARMWTLEGHYIGIRI